MKTRMYVVMLILGCLLAMGVYAAKEGLKEDVAATGTTDAAGPGAKQKAVAFKTELDKVSYAIGTQLGQNFKQQGIEINVELMVRGMKDAMGGKDLALTQDEMRQVMMSFQQRMMAQQKAESAKNLAAGNAFLEANKAKEGVKVLPSGLQYKVIKEGTGKTPAASDRVKTNYRGRLLDGTEFDSSFRRNKPAEFRVMGVIPGWTEALQLMKEGAKWELYIPVNLAYGERGKPPKIPPNSVLVFELELIEVVK